MKRTLSLILAILMVVTIFATVGMAEDEPEAAGEPETVETAAPAAEGPAAPVEEAPAEPAPAAEPEVVVPASEPAGEPVAEPIAEPAPISESVAEPEPEPASEVNWVELDCNGGSHLGYTKFYADVFDGLLCSNLTPVRDGYEFVGWYVDKDSADKAGEGAIHNGDPVESGKTLYAGWTPIPEPSKPPVTTDNYKYGVWLTVVNGNFTGNYTVNGKPEQDITNAASVWVEFQDVKARTLPSSGLPTATRSDGEFKGWYTQAPTEVLESKDGYSYWKTTAYNGQEVGAGQPVPEGVQVLYAAFTDKQVASDADKKVTFKLNWNGMFGKTSAMTCTRPYGSSFTAADAAVFGLNFVDDENAPKEITWESLKKYWETARFDGYKFLGWSKDSEGKEMISSDTSITDGDVFYAQSEKDGVKTPTPTPAPTPGQVETIRIDAPHMTVRMDPNKTNSVTVSAFVTPVGGSHDGITWTVEVPPTVSENNYANLFKPSQVYTINGSKIDKAKDKNGVMATDDPKFTAKAEGLTLTITPNPGCSQVLYVSAECNGKTTPAPATVIIEHEVSEVKTVVRAATCTAAGEEGFVCAECGEVTDAETLPATGHSFCGHATCEVCGEAGKKGDPSGDGAIDTSDVRVLFLAAMNDGEGVAPEIGDVTGDGVIDTSDVRVLFLAAMNDGSLPG